MDNSNQCDELILLPRPRQLRLNGGKVDYDMLHKVSVNITPNSDIRTEAYRLSVTSTGVTINATDEAGIFYGQQTLGQIIRQLPEGCKCPALEIEDYPEFSCRGFLLDVSRDRIPKMDNLLEFIDQLASWKINHLQLYNEHAFAYRDHEKVWADGSPFTAEEIRRIDSFCRERFIDLVPVQNSLGHMLRWLCHDDYRQLAECPDGFHSSWSMSERDPFSLCPTDPASLKFVDSLLTELLPNFSSRYFNSCCDEAVDIGKGRSRKDCEKHGQGRVFLNYVLSLNEVIKRHKRKMMVFGDILNNYPELFSELPKDIEIIEWGYGVNCPFAESGRRFAATGIPFYFMVSNSNYSSTAGRTYRWQGNIRNAVFAGMETCAKGIINTEWGDFGHWHNWSLSQPGIAYGAAMCWAPNENQQIDIAKALDEFVFGAKDIGALILDLGRVYHHVSKDDDSDALLLMLRYNERRKDDPVFANLTMNGLERMERDLDSIECRLQRLEIISDHFRAELEQSIRYTRFGIHCAREWLCDENANFLRELSLGAQQRLAGEFRTVIELALAIRDCGYRPGGRNAAIFWLKQYWSNVCGSLPFPF